MHIQMRIYFVHTIGWPNTLITSLNVRAIQKIIIKGYDLVHTSMYTLVCMQIIIHKIFKVKTVKPSLIAVLH